MRASMFVLSLLAGSGCLKSFGPDLGSELACQGADCVDGNTGLDDTTGGCNNADSDPSTMVRFNGDIVTTILLPYKCRDCHSGNGDGKSQSKLDLASYATLRVGGSRSGAGIVVPNAPCNSILYQKVTPTPPFGRRMPRDSSTTLTPAHMRLLADWIAEGANEN